MVRIMRTRTNRLMRLIFSFGWCWIVVVALQMTYVGLAGDETTIAGKLGNWRVSRVGVGNLNGAGRALPGAVATVARALDAARDLDIAAFGECFSPRLAGDQHSQVKAWYEEWRLCSREYIYVIGEEAVLAQAGQSTSNALVAISIAPSTPIIPKRQFPDTPNLRAHVVFVRQAGTGWQLMSEVADEKIADYLLSRAAQLVYRPIPYVFRTDEEAQEAFKKDEINNHEKLFQQMKSRGAPAWELNGLTESFRLRTGGVSVNTWESWTNHYKAKLLDPPVIFDVNEPSPIDFSTPIAALRSYERAILIGDSKTLLNNSDTSGRAWLKQQLKVDENDKRPTYELFPKISRYTVLLTAGNTFEGKEYTLVLALAQENTEPKLGRVCFTVEVFRHEKNGFLLTRDLFLNAPFTRVTVVARANGANLLRYMEFFERVKGSSFPPYFYTIE